MQMTKYGIKRILLMFLTLFIIFTICFVLIKSLPMTVSGGTADQTQEEIARLERLGYNKPVMEQYGIYLKNIFTQWDWGTSWKIEKNADVTQVLFSRIAPTLILNVYSLIIAIPLGIGLGILAALKKNRWQDHLISTVVILFVSVPSYVYAFLVQYLLYFKAGAFPSVIYSLADAGKALGLTDAAVQAMIANGESWRLWLSGPMLYSMVLPVMSLSFGTIAGLARFTRAELTEVLTSDFMLLARAKGLTKAQATTRHALRNAMVPILPMIIGEFASVLSGSLIIERIFSVPGVGALYLNSINQLDYDVFMFVSMFYTLISLSASLLIDLSYGFIDPRIRMGAK